MLYELIFKRKLFTSSDDIFYFDYMIRNECDEELKFILMKLLRNENRIILAKDLIIDMKIKKKLLEVNLFDELIAGNTKGKL